MPQIERITSRGQLVHFRFTHNSAADSQSAAAMQTLQSSAGSSETTEYTVPWDYDVVGISVAGDTPRTAGTLTVDATIDGTVTGLQAALDATNTQYHYASQTFDTDVGTAGSRVGCKITTSSWTPVAADVEVLVYCIVRLDF